MKKLVLIAALMLAGIQCWCQTLDTIRWYERKPDLYYWGSNWVDSVMMEYPDEITYGVYGKTFQNSYLDCYWGRACYTPHPLQVIGIAAPVSIATYNITLFSDRLPEYFQLYQHEGDTVIFKAETRWDTATPQHLFEFRRYILLDDEYYLNYAPLYETYFDSEKPIIVHDTFYVGGTSHNNLEVGKNIEELGVFFSYYVRKPTIYYRYGTITPSVYTTIPELAYSIKKYYWPCEFLYNPESSIFNYDTTQFYYDSTTEWLAFFAIFDTNFVSMYGSCMEMKTMGLHVADIDSAAVGLTWDDSGVEEWQVEVKPVGTDSCMLFSTPINYLQVTGLDTGVWYVARARTQCDTDLFGSWSDTLLFYVPRHSCNTPTWFHVAALDSGSVTLAWNNANVLSWKVMMGLVDLGMSNAQTTTVTTNSLHVDGLYGDCWYWARVRALCDTASYTDWTDTIHFLVPNQHPSGPDTTNAINLVEQYTYLMPNPAREEVTVMSSFKVRSVELYAADGKLLQEQEVNAIGTRLSLEGLPAGVYFVRVRTTAGVTTKRLVVE